MPSIKNNLKTKLLGTESKTVLSRKLFSDNYKKMPSIAINILRQLIEIKSKGQVERRDLSNTQNCSQLKIRSNQFQELIKLIVESYNGKEGKRKHTYENRFTNCSHSNKTRQECNKNMGSHKVRNNRREDGKCNRSKDCSH